MASPTENTLCESACFFCRKRENDVPLEVDLYKVTKRQETYIVVGMGIKLGYQTMRIDVPRCGNCKRKHYLFGLIGGIPACLVLLAAIGLCGLAGWRWWEAGAVFDFGLFLGFLVSVIVGIYMCFAALGLVFMIVEFIADCVGCNTERRSQKYEPLAAPLRSGWNLGTKPHKSEDVEDA